MEGDDMKKLIVIALIMTLYTIGCGHVAKESEFYDHNAMYKNLDHMKFSMWGYKSPTTEVAQASTSEGWWGIDIPYVPAK